MKSANKLTIDSLLVGDFLQFLIETEEYELAAVMRDEFLDKM